MLKVPYVKQINEAACGVAALEMVYKWYGVTNFFQEKTFNAYKALEPHNTGNLRITTDDLVKNARDNGFNSGWLRVNYASVEDSLFALKIFLNKVKIPIIVCQQSKTDPRLGHFKVVIDVKDREIFFHDPNQVLNGENLNCPIETFLKCWQPTGYNVTGGVFIFITNQQ